MTKAGKREKNSESRRQAWKEWNRGHRGICGRWFTKKMLAVFLFVLCCWYAIFVLSASFYSRLNSIGIVLAFTIPRVPAFAFNTDTPLANATGAWKDAIPTIFSRAPANFSFPGIAELQVDTSSNFLPLTFNNLEATIFDYDTGVQIGTGSLGHRTFPAKALTSFQIPLNFTYSAVNTSDPTCEFRLFLSLCSCTNPLSGTAWYQACRNAIDDVGGVRPGKSFFPSPSFRI